MKHKVIITIGREFGTGGRQVATRLGELLGVKVYDRHLLDSLIDKYHLTIEEMDRIKASKIHWWDDFVRFYQKPSVWTENNGMIDVEVTSSLLYHEEERILKALAEQESCIILGRTGFYVFREDPNAFKVFLIADMDYRRDKVARRLNIREGEADILIRKVDEARENFTRTFSGNSRYDVHNYDIVLNVTNMDTEQIAQFIAGCVRAQTSCIENNPPRMAGEHIQQRD